MSREMIDRVFASSVDFLSPTTLAVIQATLNALKSISAFFKFKSSEASIKHYSGKVTINTQVLTNIRDLIKNKIAAHAIDCAMALPDWKEPVPNPTIVSEAVLRMGSFPPYDL